MTEAYLSIGGNLGDRLANLQAVVRMLGDREEIAVREASSLYETEPFGVTGQPDYLNAVLRIETGLEPEALLDTCQLIEARLGRVRIERWGARPVDIDILTYGSLRQVDVRLTLPHPRMTERAFVQIPLQELRKGRIEWTDEVRPFAFDWCPWCRRTPLWVHPYRDRIDQRRREAAGHSGSAWRIGGRRGPSDRRTRPDGACVAVRRGCRRMDVDSAAAGRHGLQAGRTAPAGSRPGCRSPSTRARRARTAQMAQRCAYK